MATPPRVQPAPGIAGHRQVTPYIPPLLSLIVCEQIRVYYLGASNAIQEYCYTSGKGWYRGTINSVGLKANPGAGIAAVTWHDSSGGVHIRVYCQSGCRLSLARYPSVDTPKRGRWQFHCGK